MFRLLIIIMFGLIVFTGAVSTEISSSPMTGVIYNDNWEIIGYQDITGIDSINLIMRTNGMVEIIDFIKNTVINNMYMFLLYFMAVMLNKLLKINLF